MKKIAALIVGFVVAFAAIGTHFVARAGVTCSLPFQLQNATTADATQVMANYNALVTCLANAAAAGANNDITSLAALSTPITTAQGGTPVYVGGTSTGGSGNAHVLASVSPSNFALTAGKQVTFVAGLGNNTAATLNVAGTGAINIFRRTQLGISATVGGEIVAGQPVTVIYDGTEFVLVSVGPALVGDIRDYGGSSAPTGWAIIDGSCQLRAGVFADLFSIVGTTYDPTGSTCDVAHFALPDGRGRVLAGKDTTGARITVAGSGCNGNVLGGAGCGSQNHTITIGEIPVITPTGANSGTQTILADTGGAASGGGGGGFNTNFAINQSLTIFGSSFPWTGNAFGGGGTMPILNPLQIVTKIIKL